MTHVRLPAVEDADVQHAHAVLAPDLDRRAPLAQEPLDHLGLSRHGREQKLDGDALLELQVRREDHRAHAARAEEALDRVLPGDDLARPGDASQVGLLRIHRLA